MVKLYLTPSDVKYDLKNKSCQKYAMLLKLSRDVVPYEIYQMVHILILLWQHARFWYLPL